MDLKEALYNPTKFDPRNYEKKCERRNKSIVVKNLSLKFILTTSIIGGLSGWAGG